MMEDQAGFEPAMGARHRIKSPIRSATTVTGPDLEDAVGLEPTMRVLQHLMRFWRTLIRLSANRG